MGWWGCGGAWGGVGVCVRVAGGVVVRVRVRSVGAPQMPFACLPSQHFRHYYVMRLKRGSPAAAVNARYSAML